MIAPSTDLARSDAPGRAAVWIAVALSLSATAFAYWSILAGYFREDDFLFLYESADRSVAEFARMNYAGHLLFARNLVFSCMHRLFGMDPVPYQACMLLTHLLGVALLFEVLRRSTGRVLLAATTAVLWGTSAVYASAVSWFSAHHVLVVNVATFGVLADLVRCTTSGREVSPGRVALWCAAMIVAAGSHGFGLPIATLLAPLVTLVLGDVPGRRRAIVLAATMFVVVPGMFFAMSSSTGGMAGVSVGAPGEVARLFVELFACGVSGLLWPVSPCGSLSGAERATAVVAFAVVTGAAFVFGDSLSRRRLVAALGLAVVTYGVVASTRTWLGALPGWTLLQAAAEPRYHYVASCLLALAAGWAVSVLLGARVVVRRIAMVAVAAIVAFAVAGAGTPRITVFGKRYRAEVATVLSAVERAVRDAGPGGDVLVENRPFLGVGVGVGMASAADYERTGARFPGWGAVFFIAHPDGVYLGRRVRFVERHPQVLDALRSDPSRRSASLFVGAGVD